MHVDVYNDDPPDTTCTGTATQPLDSAFLMDTCMDLDPNDNPGTVFGFVTCTAPGSIKIDVYTDSACTSAVQQTFTKQTGCHPNQDASAYEKATW